MIPSSSARGMSLSDPSVEVRGADHRVPAPTTAIFFDVGETLIRPRRPYGVLLAEIAETLEIDLPAKAAAGLAAHIDARVSERTRHGLPFTFPAATSQAFWLETYCTFLRRFLAASAALHLAHAFRDLLSSPAGYVLYEDALPTLVRLQDSGFRLGIISNWEAWLPELLEAVGIARLFDHIIISGLCALEKPDARIFARAVRESGYRPEELVYVGDRPAHDVAPAREAGLRPILLDRTGRYQDDIAAPRIASLHALPLALQELEADGVGCA